jgi:adenylate kinase family enzyme
MYPNIGGLLVDFNQTTFRKDHCRASRKDYHGANQKINKLNTNPYDVADFYFLDEDCLTNEDNYLSYEYYQVSYGIWTNQDGHSSLTKQLIESGKEIKEFAQKELGLDVDLYQWKIISEGEKEKYTENELKNAALKELALNKNKFMIELYKEVLKQNIPIYIVSTTPYPEIIKQYIKENFPEDLNLIRIVSGYVHEVDKSLTDGFNRKASLLKAAIEHLKKNNSNLSNDSKFFFIDDTQENLEVLPKEYKNQIQTICMPVKSEMSDSGFQESFKGRFSSLFKALYKDKGTKKLKSFMEKNELMPKNTKVNHTLLKIFLAIAVSIILIFLCVFFADITQYLQELFF